MRKRGPDPEVTVESLVDRIAAERKAIRAQLSAPPRRKGDARPKGKDGGNKDGSKLREIFRQYEGLLDT